MVFLDGTWTKTKVACTHGRAPRGQRLLMGLPHGHWHTSTVIAGQTRRGMIASCVPDGPMNRDAFETYVEQVPVPEVRRRGWRPTPRVFVMGREEGMAQGVGRRGPPKPAAAYRRLSRTGMRAPPPCSHGSE
ncbi:MAG: hypothetical protein F4X98_09790 [Gammaproteobacteria bacterium]|nr:hypothetical protein [Gammaproteobacteria bacterium]